MHVLLPPALTRLFPGCPAGLDIDATTVTGLVDSLDARWPGMRDRLCDPTPRIRRHINIFVAGERVTLDTALHEDCEVVIMTAISGG